MIMTVTGAKAPDSLGFCQCHEHLMITKGVSYEHNPALCIDDLDKSMEEASEYLKAGGNTIIDAQPGGCNRDQRALFQISKQTGINIIASTGFHKLIFYPQEHWIFTSTVSELTRFFLHELQEGMYTHIDTGFHHEFTPIRAGIIKTALDREGLTPRYRCLFTAAASAALKAGVPVMVHIEQGADPEALLDFLLAEGVPADRIMFCHMDRAVEPLPFYTRVLEKGIYLEFDTIGRFHYHGDEEEAVLIGQLADLGYGDRLLISLDTTRSRLKSYNPDGVGLTYILHTFLGILRDHGISEEQITNLTHTNCIRLFTDT